VATRYSIASEQLPPLTLPSRSWKRWLSAGISLALLIAIIVKLQGLGLAGIRHIAPRSPIFWACLASYYLALPVSEWIIFRRLWNLPLSGFGALLRKLVSNEVLLGYSGELSFYAWARRHGALTAAPFGAIKDVSITSALAGNIATLVMMILAWPFLADFPAIVGQDNFLLSIGLILTLSLVPVLLGRKIFSLPRRDILCVLGIHLARLATTTTLLGLMWHSALPGVAMTWWIVLAALHLLVTRLPFVSNKDLVFANIALLVVGDHSDVGTLLALIATTILLAHLSIGGLLAVADLLDDADAP